MPNKSRKPHANQPNIQPVLPETWQALLAKADDFNRLAPWKWMHDSHIAGLRHPLTNEVLLGSILGRQRTVFGVLVYRREAGHRWLLNTILDAENLNDLASEESAFEQDLLKLEFVAKGELWPEDHAVLAASGYAPAIKRGRIWPQFRSMFPGCFPWHLTQGEAETLLFALPRIASLARLTREHPEIWDAHLNGDIACLPIDFDPDLGDLQHDQIVWKPMIPPPEPPPFHVSFDEPTRAQLLKLPKAKGFHLELDVFYSIFSVLEPDRPRFPKTALAVDHGSGFVGGVHNGTSVDHDGAEALGIVLRDSIIQFGRRPETFRVQRPRVASMLSGIALELGVSLRRDAELDELNYARHSLETRLQRGR